VVDGSVESDQHVTGFKFPGSPGVAGTVASTVTGISAGAAAVDARLARTVTKAELADALFERLGLNKREAKDMVDGFFDEIRLALQRGESVKLSGFGNFQLRDKPQRPGRNPKTGEEIAITARRVVTFHASHKLKSTVSRANEAS
jgi:integration host factor subunit alpha